MHVNERAHRHDCQANGQEPKSAEQHEKDESLDNEPDA
jgi:hypothetical protein